MSHSDYEQWEKDRREMGRFYRVVAWICGGILLTALIKEIARLFV